MIYYCFIHIKGYKGYIQSIFQPDFRKGSTWIFATGFRWLQILAENIKVPEVPKFDPYKTEKHIIIYHRNIIIYYLFIYIYIHTHIVCVDKIYGIYGLPVDKNSERMHFLSLQDRILRCVEEAGSPDMTQLWNHERSQQIRYGSIVHSMHPESCNS